MRATTERKIASPRIEAAIRPLLSAEGWQEARLADVLAAVCAGCDADGAAVIDRRVEEGRASVRLAARYPGGDAASPPAWAVQAMRVVAQRPPLSVAVLPASETSDGAHLVLLPLTLGAEAGSVAAFVVVGSRDAAESRRDVLTLACGALSLWSARRATRGRELEARLAADAVALAADVGRRRRFATAAIALCDGVAARWRATRVTLGVVRSGRVKVVAMSRTEHLDRKMALVRTIEDAMEECLDQGVEVSWPPPPDRAVVARAAAELGRGQGAAEVVSIPILAVGVDGEPDEVGAILTAEFGAAEGETGEGRRQAVEALRIACGMVAPLLLELRRADRWLIVKAADRVQRTAGWFVGPTHTGAKLAAIAGAAALAAVCLVRAPHRVTGSVLVEAQDRHVVAAPFSGYLAEVGVQPGSPVVGGVTALAELETADLRLELSQKVADRAHYLKRADLARRDGDPAEAQIAALEAARVEAEADLLRHHLSRAVLVSPIDGVVLEGDRMRRRGGAVSRGEALFEVAPAEGLRAEVRVPEARIADVAPGQRGWLATAAQPGDYLPFTVDRVEPMAEVLGGQNVFRVWVTLGETPEWVRPGMEGVAKIDVGEARLVWLWTHAAIDWVRMKVWL